MDLTGLSPEPTSSGHQIHLKGRVDLVLGIDQPIIVDYKFGRVRDLAGSLEDEVLLQLAFYRLLWKASGNDGEPRIMLVEGLASRPRDLTRDVLAPADVANRIRVAEESLSQAGDEHDLQAFPSDHNCRFCEVRPACDKWPGYTRKINGIVTRSEPTPHGADLAVDISDADNSVTQGATSLRITVKQSETDEPIKTDDQLEIRGIPVRLVTTGSMDLRSATGLVVTRRINR